MATGKHKQEEVLEDPVNEEIICEHNYQMDFSACTWHRFKCTKCSNTIVLDRD